MTAILTYKILLHRRNDIYRVNKVLKLLQPFSKRYFEIALDRDEKRKSTKIANSKKKLCKISYKINRLKEDRFNYKNMK